MYVRNCYHEINTHFVIPFQYLCAQMILKLTYCLQIVSLCFEKFFAFTRKQHNDNKLNLSRKLLVGASRVKSKPIRVFDYQPTWDTDDTCSVSSSDLPLATVFKFFGLGVNLTIPDCLRNKVDGLNFVNIHSCKHSARVRDSISSINHLAFSSCLTQIFVFLLLHNLYIFPFCPSLS